MIVMGDDGSKHESARLSPVGNKSHGHEWADTDRTDPPRAYSPSLRSYYIDNKVTPVVFAKAARNSEIKQFDADERQKILSELDELDPMLARTQRLAGRPSEAIAQWVTEATRASIQRYMPKLFIEIEYSTATVFDKAVVLAIDELNGKDRHARMRSQNLLRLVLFWQIEKRNLDPAKALNSITKIKRRKRKTASSTERETQRILRGANFPKLNDLATVANLFKSELEERERESQQTLKDLSSARERISELRLELDMSRDKIKRLTNTSTIQADEIEALRKRMSDDRETAALDRTRQSARHRVLLTERIGTLLSDARDALDFNPPQTEAARQRIEMSIRAIEQEVNKTND